MSALALALVVTFGAVAIVGMLVNAAPALLRAWADYRLAATAPTDVLDVPFYTQRQVAGIILATVYRSAEPGLEDHLREELAQTIAEDLDAGRLQIPDRPDDDA